jgi:hypothetical protein
MNSPRVECVRSWIDSPLSPEGIAKAHAAAEKLKGVEFDCIITSDLQRARHTAEIVSRATGKPIIRATRGLRTWHLGQMSGKPLTECFEELADYIRLRPASAPPSGESFDDFRSRFLDELDRIRREHPGETVLICTHSKNERLLEGWRQTGGGECEQINPDAFLHKGLGPAQIRTDIVLGEGDEADEAVGGDEHDGDEADDVQPAAAARPATGVRVRLADPPARGKSTPPWNSKPIEPRHNAAQTWTQSLGGPRDAMGPARDPLGLRPEVPLKKRSQSWANTVLEPLKQGK